MSSYQYSEQSRLAALTTLDVLDTPAEARFDRFTRIAAQTFGVPIALISLVDDRRQWFKSRCGLEVAETPRSIAFCSHAVAARAMFVVEDASVDPDFMHNPLVAGAPHIRFYAGQPVFSDGQAVGTLCIIDRAPRTFSEADRQTLRDLADMVEVELNYGREAAARVMAEQALKAANAQLEQRVTARTAELEAKIEELAQEIARRKDAEVSFREADAWNRSIVAASNSGFIGSDHEGRITEWNASAERIFGWTFREVAGRSLSDVIVPPHMREAHENALRRFVSTGAATVMNKPMELPALTASGRQITVEMTISTYEWKGARYFGAFLNDVSERIQIRQQVEEQQELLNAVLDSIDVSVVACDAVGNLTIFNRAARAMHGTDMKRIAPSEWPAHYALHHADCRTPLQMDEVPLVRALKGEVVRDQAMAIAPAGQACRTMLASGRLLRGAGGRPLGAVVAMKDVTELNASREELAANERRLRAITENLPAMIGKVDADGNFVFLNSRALRAFGKAPEELIGQPVAAAYSAQEYAAIAGHIERVKAGERASFEHVAFTDGGERHFHCVFVPQIAPDGKPDGFFAMALDISARKLSELRQAESEERLRTITDNVPVLIGHIGSDGRYGFANAVHQSWLGLKPETILGQTIEQVFGDNYHAAQRQAVEQAWRGQASQCEHEIVRKNHLRVVHTTFLPQLRGGKVEGIYILTTDATASRAHERSLHRLAHTDSLTELPNRRRFEQALEESARRSRQSDRDCAVLFLDVDHFKQINDRHGHAIGDAVLVEFARRLRSVVRSSDIVARLAGDEFTVLLTDVGSDHDVELVARKILQAIRLPFKLASGILDVTTTIGAARSGAMPADVEPKALMDLADQALYRAKAAGRNTYALLALEAVCG